MSRKSGSQSLLGWPLCCLWLSEEALPVLFGFVVAVLRQEYLAYGGEERWSLIAPKVHNTIWAFASVGLVWVFYFILHITGYFQIYSSTDSAILIWRCASSALLRQTSAVATVPISCAGGAPAELFWRRAVLRACQRWARGIREQCQGQRRG